MGSQIQSRWHSTGIGFRRQVHCNLWLCIVASHFITSHLSVNLSTVLLFIVAFICFVNFLNWFRFIRYNFLLIKSSSSKSNNVTRRSRVGLYFVHITRGWLFPFFVVVHRGYNRIHEVNAWVQTTKRNVLHYWVDTNLDLKCWSTSYLCCLSVSIKPLIRLLNAGLCLSPSLCMSPKYLT